MVNCFSYCINAFQCFRLQFSIKYIDDAFFYHIPSLLAFLIGACRRCSVTSSPMTKPSMHMSQQRQPRHARDIDNSHCYITQTMSRNSMRRSVCRRYRLPLSRGPRVVVLKTILAQTQYNGLGPGGAAVMVFCSVRILQNRLFTEDSTAEVCISSLM
jgi:hypothetical protein